MSALRVAMVCSSLVQAGAEKQFVYMARALHEAGVDARVFNLGTELFYEKALRQIGVPTIHLSNPGRPLRILWELVRALRRFHPHIVMGGQYRDVIHAGIAGRLCGAMTIGGVRCDGFYEMNQHKGRIWLMRRLPHALIANSYAAPRNMAPFGFDAKFTKVLSNVIDLEDFDRKSGEPVSAPIEPGRIVVVGIGRLHRQKRFDRLLDALASAQNAVPALFGLVVGRDEGEKKALEDKAKSLGLGPSRLVFMGGSDKVPALLKQCHILAQPSDYEGFANTIIEGMAVRLPVISTPAGDASRVIQNGETGYIVDFEDTKGMAEHIVRLAQSDELRQRLGAAGRRRLEEQHAFAGLSQRLLKIFSDIAEMEQRGSLAAILKGIRPGAEYNLARTRALEAV